jgi:hypothetical protein
LPCHDKKGDEKLQMRVIRCDPARIQAAAFAPSFFENANSLRTPLHAFDQMAYKFRHNGLLRPARGSHATMQDRFSTFPARRFGVFCGPK